MKKRAVIASPSNKMEQDANLCSNLPQSSQIRGDNVNYGTHQIFRKFSSSYAQPNHACFPKSSEIVSNPSLFSPLHWYQTTPKREREV